MAEPPRARPEASGSAALVASVVYGLLVVAALGWLWLRERGGQLPALALGEAGLWSSAGLGVAVGLGISGLAAVSSRYVPLFARLEERLAAMIGPLDEPQITIVALSSALGEELFFRLAMQDALGLWWTALAFGLLHVGPRGTWLWTALAAAFGIVFGWMIQLGCGLLSVTVAHALVNYLSLRRMNR